MKFKCNTYSLFVLCWTVYLCSYILLITSELSYKYDVSGLFSYLRAFSIAGFIVLAISKPYKKNRLCIIFFVLMSTAVSLLNAHSVSFFMIIICGFAMEKRWLKKFIRFDCRLRLLLVIFIVLLCLLNIIDDYTFFMSDRGVRHSFGFVHPNTFAIHIGTIIAEYVFLNFKKKKALFLVIISFVILCIINTSRTVRYSILLIAVFLVLLNRRNFLILLHNNKKIKTIIVFLPGLICLLCFIGAIFYRNNSTFWNTLDNFLTTRIHFASKYLMTYGIKLFGTNIEPVIRRTADISGELYSNSFDMSYVRIGVEYGGIVLLIFIASLIILMKYSIENNKWSLLLVAFYFLMIGITENALFSIGFNPFLVCIVFAISGELNHISDFIIRKKLSNKLSNKFWVK